MAVIRANNFGPLRECSLTSGKVTVFIGPQGSGKSTMSRLYCALSWIEKSLRRGSLAKEDLTAERFITILGYLQLDSLFEEKTEISYKGDYASLSFSGGSITVHTEKSSHYYLPKLLYIPSERSYLSMSNEFLSVGNLPSAFYELAADYSMARNALTGQGFDLPVNGFHFTYSKADGTSLITEKGSSYSVRLEKAASGIQSVLPLSLVFAHYSNALQYRIRTGYSILSVQQRTRIQEKAEEFTCDARITGEGPIENILKAAGIDAVPSDDNSRKELFDSVAGFMDLRLTAVVEEPEQNLFPLAQKELVEFLVRGNNRPEGSIIMTTHSPYVLTSLNNLIFAGEHHDDAGIGKIIPPEVQLKYSDVSAYYFQGGSCSSIMDGEMRCIDPSAIDSCSDEINNTYALLEDIVYGSKG